MTDSGGPGRAPSYAAPYRAPSDPRYAAVVEPPRPVRTQRLGRIACVLAIGALVIASVPVALAAWVCGQAIADAGGAWDWAALSPVRSTVIFGEAGFWTGTMLGVWALVQGIVAIRTGRGRTSGIWAVAVAALAPALIVIVSGALLLAALAGGA